MFFWIAKTQERSSCLNLAYYKNNILFLLMNKANKTHDVCKLDIYS